MAVETKIAAETLLTKETKFKQILQEISSASAEMVIVIDCQAIDLDEDKMADLLDAFANNIHHPTLNFDKTDFIYLSVTVIDENLAINIMISEFYYPFAEKMMAIIAKVLQKNNTIKYFQLAGQHMMSHDQELIANMLKINKTITHVVLNIDMGYDQEAKSWAQVLENNYTLNSITLPVFYSATQYCTIRYDEKAKFLSEALIKNTSISELTLSSDNIYDLKTIISFLSFNNNIHTIKIFTVELKEWASEAKYLNEFLKEMRIALSHNTSLRKIITNRTDPINIIQKSPIIKKILARNKQIFEVFSKLQELQHPKDLDTILALDKRFSEVCKTLEDEKHSPSNLLRLRNEFAFALCNLIEPQEEPSGKIASLPAGILSIAQKMELGFFSIQEKINHLIALCKTAHHETFKKQALLKLYEFSFSQAMFSTKKKTDGERNNSIVNKEYFILSYVCALHGPDDEQSSTEMTIALSFWLDKTLDIKLDHTKLIKEIAEKNPELYAKLKTAYLHCCRSLNLEPKATFHSKTAEQASELALVSNKSASPDNMPSGLGLMTPKVKVSLQAFSLDDDNDMLMEPAQEGDLKSGKEAKYQQEQREQVKIEQALPKEPMQTSAAATFAATATSAAATTDAQQSLVLLAQTKLRAGSEHKIRKLENGEKEKQVSPDDSETSSFSQIDSTSKKRKFT